MRPKPHIAIVGAGPAGLAAAIAFSRKLDARVVVFERAARLEPVGAGVLLQPIGLAVLDALGLLDRIASAGSRVDRLYGTNPNGRTVMDLAYADLGDGVHGIGIARRRLHAILVDAFSRTSATLELGRAIDDPSSLNGFDLVVLADGARSVLRDRCGFDVRVRPYPWAAVWATVPGTGVPGVLRQFYRGAHEMLGLLPSGDADAEEPALVTFFWSLPPAGYDAWRATPLDAWKSRVLALAPIAAPVLEALPAHDALSFARYVDVRIASPHGLCGGTPVVAIGDCAHAMSPQLGQGVNLALLDAHALANALARHGVGADALRAYADRRRRHVRYYQWASRWLTPLFQSHARVLPLLRDAFAGWAFRAPYVGRQSLHTLAGTKTGILRAARTADELLRAHEFPASTSTE